jgi:hypothetical protein
VAGAWTQYVDMNLPITLLLHWCYTTVISTDSALQLKKSKLFFGMLNTSVSGNIVCNLYNLLGRVGNTFSENKDLTFWVDSLWVP